jgi:transposase InsO family protein
MLTRSRVSAGRLGALKRCPAAHDPKQCRVLSVVDAYTRECLALEMDTSFASQRVTQVLDGIVAERGQPKVIRGGNRPELASRHFLAWCVERQIELVHIQPSKPTQNARIESFHGRSREESLAVSWLRNLFDARRRRSCTARSARAAVWDTARRKSPRRRKQRASTQLSERQGTLTEAVTKLQLVSTRR